MSFAALLCGRLSLTADYPDIADTKCNDATDLERTYWNPELFFLCLTSAYSTINELVVLPMRLSFVGCNR